MAYSIDGLRGYTSFEFPHGHYFEGDLSEILRMYKVLVEDYNTLVNEIVEAHRLYLEAQDFVERQERIFLDNQTKIMLRFKEVMDEANRLQQELVYWFDEATEDIRNEEQQLEELFRQLNTQQLEQMKQYFDDTIKQFAQERQHFENLFEESMDELDASFDMIIETITNNYEAFKQYIGSEFDVLTNLLAQNSNTIAEYTNGVHVNYNRLLEEYIEKLEIFRSTIIRENNLRFDAERDTTNDDFKKFKKYVDDLIAEVNEEIEKTKAINNHVLVEHIHVVSPVTRKIRKLQWALNEMYVFYRAWALRAEEYDALNLTAKQYDEWVGNLGLYPQGVGIKALDYDALAKWILLEKPDILEQVRDDITTITYEELEKNADRIVEEMTQRLEDGWGQKVVSLEAKTRVLENEINRSIEYTADVETQLKEHIAVAERAAIAIRQKFEQIDTTTSVFDGRINVLENTSSIFAGELKLLDDKILATASVFDGRMNLLDDKILATASMFDGRMNLLDDKIIATASVFDGRMNLLDNKILATASVFDGRMNTVEDAISQLVGAVLNMQEIVLKSLGGNDNG